MKSDRGSFDYEPVTRTRPDHGRHSEDARLGNTDVQSSFIEVVPAEAELRSIVPQGHTRDENLAIILRRGHALSYAVLFLYLVFVYFRPYELLPSLAPLISVVFWLGLAVLVVFIPLQLLLEGSLTARPREVDLAILFCVVGLLSIIFANNRTLAWDEFTFVFIKALMIFVVMVNVVRTDRRLRGLLLLAISVGCVISVNALNKFRLGQFDQGDELGRVVGNIGGMFGNQNDMALHLVTMIPIVVGLLLATPNLLKKVVYLGCVLLMLAGNFVTFSRGAFLGLIAGVATLIWKLGRSNRALGLAIIIIAFAAGLILVPGRYGGRIASIFQPSGDESASTRKQLLFDSLYVSLRHPLFGVGMGNSRNMLTRGQVSHNAYTQVASEMGLAAVAFYVMFIIIPLRSLRRIERTTPLNRVDQRSRYLAVGLQASIICYMVTSFFLSVAYQWNIYFLVGYAVCFRRIYEARVIADQPGGGAAQKAIEAKSTYAFRTNDDGY